MNPDRIKALIDLMAASDLSELSLNEGDTHLRLLRDGHVAAATPSAAPLATSSIAPAAALDGDTFDVSAALYGVLHLTPAPDQPPFVTLGDRVEAGRPCRGGSHEDVPPAQG